MVKRDAYWEFEGGYTNLLETSTLVGKLVAGPSRQELKVTPAALLREKGTPVELEFEVVHRIRSRTRGDFTWELLPELRFRAALLAPGTSYVGNHKVPEESFGVQWAVESRVTGSVTSEKGGTLVAAEAGTRLSQIWVECFEGGWSAVGALTAAWQHFANPLDSSKIRSLKDGQLIRWNWLGSSTISFGVDWDMTKGWQVSGGAASVEGLLRIRSSAGMRAGITLQRTGSFSLTVKRRGKTVSATLRKERNRERETRFGVRARLGTGVSLRSGSDWLDPLLKPIQRGIRDAIARKAELSIGLSEARWRRRKTVLYATFDVGKGEEIEHEYERFLGGHIRPKQPGVTYKGSFTTLLGRRLDLSFEVFDWVRLGRSTDRENSATIEVTPEGRIRIERGVRLDKSSYRGDEVTFFRIASTQLLPGERRPSFDWTSGWEGKLSRQRLQATLATALHVQALDSFSVPGRHQASGEVRMVWLTRFTEEGIECVRLKDALDWRKGLVRSLELADPPRYSAGSYWRDWIESREVRKLVEADPVNAHLKSKYPIGGRSEFQRRQVVTAYLKVRRFLSICEKWKEDESIEAFEPNLGLPLFLWFHLLCPAEMQRSALMILGALNLSWGDADLLAELEGVQKGGS